MNFFNFSELGLRSALGDSIMVTLMASEKGNQQSITFKKTIIYLYFNNASYFVYTFHTKHISKYCLENKNGGNDIGKY